VLKAAGHEVIFLRDCIATGSPDDLVCAAAEANEAILVACDGDMRQMVTKFGIGAGRFKRLSLLKVTCSSPTAAARVQAALSLIEHEWAVSTGTAVRRLFMEIKPATITTNR